MKASVAPPTAVFRQPKRSVNMLTTGEQKKIMPMAKAPTQAVGKKEFTVRGKWKFSKKSYTGLYKVTTRK